MLKANKKTLIIASIVTVLPILIGVLTWDRLPDVMATHFGIDNEANGWSLVKNDLPTRINGEAVTYSWREQEAVGYTLDSMTTNGIATIFTNRIVNVPKVPANQPQPKTPGDTWFVFEEYDTALGIPILINHVGDCFD